MHLGDLANAEVSVPDGAGAIDITGLTADSRKAAAGYLFAALPGTAADGALFAADAVRRGAVAVLAGRDARLAPDGVPIVRAADPRRALALIAARFYPAQPAHLVAVTGTAGKTSVAAFVRQIFSFAGYRSASVGTLGVISDGWTEYGTLTTPDPVWLAASLDRLARAGVTHAAVEASSHGLDQRRLDGLRLEAAAFTNLGRDHMDYHATVEDYFAAKLRLFEALLPSGGTAVVDMDDPRSQAVAAVAAARGQRPIRTGKAGRELRLLTLAPTGGGQAMGVDVFGRRQEVLLPLSGAFQASNALVAAGLAIAAGLDADAAIASLSRLSGAPGRLEKVGAKANGAAVFVDYAHKPEALKSALAALRPMATGRLVVVFGAGGNRDAGKRPLMGAIAAQAADVVIVTDDNPRNEDPAAIRRAILAAAPGALEIADRADAIRAAVAMLGPGDVLCVAGKGHETGQIFADRTVHFSDHEAVRAALAEETAT
jgi:UDP-N-acetylmuramoyl-L-alanyl-D-glutamate--2,6-diaminopimelate ligase